MGKVNLWVAESTAARVGTLKVASTKTIVVEGKAITYPAVRIVFHPAWTVAKRIQGADGRAAVTPDIGPDYCNIAGLPPSIVSSLESHPDYGVDWLNKLDAHLEKRSGELSIKRADKIPSRPVEVTLSADQLERMREVYEASGEPLPEFLGGSDDSGSAASQGVIGADKMAVSDGRGSKSKK